MNDLKSSLIENGACLIAFPVYNYSDQMWIQNDNEKMTGGHAMTVVGYDDKEEHFIIRNSWGVEWGDKGYFYMPYSYITNKNLCSDFWVVQKVFDKKE